MPELVVTLTLEEESALIARASAQATSVDSLLRRVIMQIISETAEKSPKPVTMTAEECDAVLDEVADMIQAIVRCRMTP